MKKVGVTVLLVVIGLVVATLGVGFLSLHTAPVQRMIAREVSRSLSEKTGREVRIERIAPALPLHFVVEGVSVEGLLEAERVELSWRPTGLFGGSLAFGYIHSPKLKLQLGDGQPNGELEWPNLPIGLSIERLSVDRLEISSDNKPLTAAVRGELGIKRHGGDFAGEMRITPLEAELGTYLFEVRGAAAAQDIFLHARTLPSERTTVKRFLAAAGINVRAFNIHAYGKLDSWSAVLAGKGGGEEQQLLGDFTVVVSTEKGGNTIASRLVGERADLEGVFSIDGERILRLKPLSADGDHIRLKGEVVTSLAGDIRNANVKLTVKDLSALDGIAALTYTGSATADLSLFGRAPNPTLSVELKGSGVTVEGRSVQDLQAQVIVHFEEGGPQGTAKGSGKLENLPITASMDLRQRDEKCWELANFRAETKGSLLTGELQVCESGLAGGTLHGQFSRLLDWAPTFGLDLEGNTTFDITLTENSLTVDAVAPVLTYDRFTAELAEVHATLERPFEPLTGTISLSAEDFFYKQLEFNHFTFETELGGEAWPFTTEWAASETSNHEAAASGTWSFRDQTLSTSLEEFEGNLFNEEVRLIQPLSVRYNQSEGLTFSPLSLLAGAGSLKLAYAPRDPAEPIRFEARQFPLTVLELLFPQAPIIGTLDGTILLSDVDRKPSGVIEISWNNVELKDPLLLDIQSVSGRIDGQLRNGIFDITIAANSEAGSPLDAHLRVPLIAEGPPLEFTVPDDGALDGHAAFSGQLGPLLQFFLPDTAVISGDLVATVDISGTAASPIVKGELTVSRGTFEDYYSGAILADIAARLVADGPVITLERLTATDGASGTLVATGQIEIDPAADYPFQIDLDTKKMLLVNLEIAQSHLSGHLTFGGTLLAPKLTGAMNVDNLTIDLEHDLPARIPRLNVTYINVPPSQKQKRERDHLVTIPLDVLLISNNTSRLVGNGIESVWTGEARLAGTAARPELHGNLTLTKGSFSLAGRDFNLTSGAIAFAGDPATRTNIQIIGSDTIEEIEINAELKGTLPNISLTFYSSPALSTQEILSYLIFGRSSKDATSGQLSQLNQASIDISKGDYTEPAWQRWQQGIGLDEFTIAAPDEGDEEYGILAGKKISENFEVHVYRSINQEFNRTKIYIDLFGQFRLSGEAGNEDSERFSLVWRRNY
jgi:translocation and assembly module TamB